MVGLSGEYVRDSERELKEEEETGGKARNRGKQTGQPLRVSLLSLFFPSLCLFLPSELSKGSGALLSRQQREERETVKERVVFPQRKDARMERERSTDAFLFLLLLLPSSSQSHLLDLRQAEAERRVDPRKELVAADKVGAVRGRGHRE